MARRLVIILGIVAFALPCFAVQNSRIIAVDSSRSLYEVNRTTGATTLIGTVSANAGTCAGLAVGVNNLVYLSSTSNDSLYTLDISSGTATLVGAYGDSALVMHGLEYVPTTGTLYGVSSHDNGLYQINKTTGVASLIGTSGLSSFTNLGWDSWTSTMYATNSGTDSLYTMDLGTGVATLVGPLNGPTNPNGLAFDPLTGIMYLVDNSTDSFYTIDLATGAATLVGYMGSSNLLGLAAIPPFFGDGFETACVQPWSSSSGFIPMPFACPGGAAAEGEACPVDGTDSLTDPNGGCNSSPYSFGSIAVGGAVCATTGTYVTAAINYRDTDWYDFTVHSAGDFLVTGGAEQQLVILVADAVDCGAIQVLESMIVEPGCQDSLVIHLDPGTYTVFAAPAVFEGVPCNPSTQDYWVQVEQLP